MRLTAEPLGYSKRKDSWDLSVCNQCACADNCADGVDQLLIYEGNDPLHQRLPYIHKELSYCMESVGDNH